MASNAMNTALALPSSKTNWTATLPARAPPPPPPPQEQYPICEICAEECVDYDDKLCHGCYHKSVGADECWCASAVDACLTDRARDALKRFAEEEEEATTEFARNKICDECGCKGGCELTCVYVCGEDSDEVKQYKAVLAETLRYEAIMDMMKK